MSDRIRRLDGKIALITGAASGIGRAMADLFARHGAAVAAIDLDRKGLESLVRQQGADSATIMACEADVTQSTDCRSTVGQVIDRLGRLDILCNNAGMIRRASVLDLSEEDWDRHLAVNLKSVFLWSREVLPTMIEQKGGCILNTASGWGLTGGPRAASYCAAKGAVIQLTKAMAIDHGPQGIRVNCICPGDTDTPMLRAEATQLGLQSDDFLRSAAGRPLGRVGSPEEIALAALFLVSDESAFVTGTSLLVDGGGLAGS